MLSIVKKTLGSNQVDVVEMPEEEVLPGQVRLRMLASAICGTDIMIESGSFPWRGSAPMPLILGHEGVGRVVEVGVGVENLSCGDRVVPLSLQNFDQHLGINRSGTFAEYLTVPAEGCLQVPLCLTDETCTLLEPLAIVAHTFERSELIKEESIAIIGPGPIGLLHLLVARAVGVRRICVIGTSADRRRLELANSLGADDIICNSDCDPRSRALEATDGKGFDLVIEAAGTISGVSLALDLVRPFGRVVLKGLAHEPAVNILPIVRKSLRVAGEAGAKPQHYRKAINLIESLRIDPGAILTHKVPLAEGREAFHLMRSCQGIVAILC